MDETGSALRLGAYILVGVWEDHKTRAQEMQSRGIGVGAGNNRHPIREVLFEQHA